MGDGVGRASSCQRDDCPGPARRRSARLKDLLAITESIADHLLAGDFDQLAVLEILIERLQFRLKMTLQPWLYQNSLLF